MIEDGRDSVTHYEVLEAFGKASLVEVHLETGRTHQIRCISPRSATPAPATSPTERIPGSPTLG